MCIYIPVECLFFISILKWILFKSRLSASCQLWATSSVSTGPETENKTRKMTIRKYLLTDGCKKLLHLVLHLITNLHLPSNSIFLNFSASRTQAKTVTITSTLANLAGNLAWLRSEMFHCWMNLHSPTKFYRPFVHSTYQYVPKIYSGFNLLSHQQQKTKNVRHDETVILNCIGGDRLSR